MECDVMSPEMTVNDKMTKPLELAEWKFWDVVVGVGIRWILTNSKFGRKFEIRQEKIPSAPVTRKQDHQHTCPY
jgi:hypothetical protein